MFPVVTLLFLLYIYSENGWLDAMQCTIQFLDSIEAQRGAYGTQIRIGLFDESRISTLQYGAKKPKKISDSFLALIKRKRILEPLSRKISMNPILAIAQNTLF
ncbi:hypothetical protein ACJX0J_027311 [Zea mays]